MRIPALVLSLAFVPVLPAAEKDYAFFFGAAADAEFDIAGAETVKVLMRNQESALGFSLGIKKAAGRLTIEEGLGFRPVELAITRPDFSEVSGATLVGNSAKGAWIHTFITDVAIGPALAPFTASAFVGIDIDPAGAWATVGCVVDAKGSGTNVIPATADGCPTCAAANEHFDNKGPLIVRGPLLINSACPARPSRPLRSFLVVTWGHEPAVPRRGAAGSNLPGPGSWGPVLFRRGSIPAPSE